MKEYLKIKAKSLEAEAKMIRAAEYKQMIKATDFEDAASNKSASYDVANNELVFYFKPMNYTPEQLKRFEEKAKRARNTYRGLNDHRRVDVRREARSTHLALAFLNGRSYNQAEVISYTQPNWERILRLVEKYSEEDSRIVNQKFAQWKDAALAGITEQPQGFAGRPNSVKNMNEWVTRNFGGVVDEFLAFKQSRMPLHSEDK